MQCEINKSIVYHGVCFSCVKSKDLNSSSDITIIVDFVKYYNSLGCLLKQHIFPFFRTTTTQAISVNTGVVNKTPKIAWTTKTKVDIEYENSDLS